MKRATSILLILALALSALPAGAQTQRGVLRREITPELRLAVSRGLRHLVFKQTLSGDFDAKVPVACNALGGLAFLGGGYTLETGPGKYTAALQKATDALLRRQNETGYFDDGASRMYGHGFATLYLAELYGTPGGSGDKVRTALKAALKVIEGSQSRDGGWDYEPDPAYCRGSKQYTGSDTSITVCQTMALRAARNLGIKVSSRIIARAQAYIRQAQNSDGGFRYRQNMYGGAFARSTFPRSAAGVCILYSLGDYNSPQIRRGFDYLRDNYRFPWSNKFPYYAHYYCAQAMFQAGGNYWRDYFPWVSQALRRKQSRDGSWKAGLQENSAQATAMALIVLQLPYRFLPIHER